MRQRAEERWVASCIELATPGVTVRFNDDGSRPAMHDLDLYRGSSRIGVCEVTAAADSQTIELWNLVNGGTDVWVEPGLVGGWMIELLPTCRVKRLRKELGGLLKTLEQTGVRRISAGRAGKTGIVVDQLTDLGIVSAIQSNTAYQGSVYFTIQLGPERQGGAVPITGDALAKWLANWIKLPKQEHNLEKLAKVDVDERHLFVIFPALSPAPFRVTDVLCRDSGPLPTITPELPSVITHLWAVSTWSAGSVFHWNSADGWRRHTKGAW